MASAFLFQWNKGKNTEVLPNVPLQSGVLAPPGPPALHREPCHSWAGPHVAVWRAVHRGAPRGLCWPELTAAPGPQPSSTSPVAPLGRFHPQIGPSSRPRRLPSVWAGGGAGRERLWLKLRSFSRSGPLSLLDTSGILGPETQHALQRLYLLTQEIRAWPC